MKEWTPARRHSFIVSTLRAGSRRWPPKYQCLNNAFVEKKINVSTGRMSKHFKCNKCKKHFPTSQVAVDHIKPVVGKEGFTTWDSFIENLFCEIEGLQVLCETCHNKKTKKEQTIRKKERNANQETNRD